MIETTWGTDLDLAVRQQNLKPTLFVRYHGRTHSRFFVELVGGSTDPYPSPAECTPAKGEVGAIAPGAPGHAAHPAFWPGAPISTAPPVRRY